jgi:trans-2-enoyl-CoA reductase
MTRISRLPTEELGQLIATCQSIAEYNKKHFFSDKFFKHVTDQLDNNVRVAFDHCPKQLDVESWYQDHKWRCEHSPDVCELPTYKNFSNHLLKLCQ